MNAEQLTAIMRRYAESKGFRLNPDGEVVSLIIQGLLRNEQRFGYRYCPCRAITGDPEQDRKIICPCTYHEEEIRTVGHCWCGLFVAGA